MRKYITTAFLFVLFVSTIVAANYAVETWHFQPVGFGLSAPAGVWFAGLAFILRDELQRSSSARMTLVAILAGAALSALLASPALAVASVMAFASSELVDLVIFTRAGKDLRARLLSNTVGAVLDTVVFLWLAQSVLGPMSPTAVAGQVLVKAVYLAPVAVVWWWAGGARARRSAPTHLEVSA